MVFYNIFNIFLSHFDPVKYELFTYVSARSYVLCLSSLLAHRELHLADLG